MKKCFIIKMRKQNEKENQFNVVEKNFLKKKLDGKYTRMLHAVLNKSWKKHPIKTASVMQLTPYLTNHLRHAGHCWRSKNELINDILQWTPTETHHCWPTSKNLYSSILFSHWMPSQRLNKKSDG